MFTQTEPFDIVCNDGTKLQQQLNYLYEYENDILTKVYHRSRIARFQQIVQKLISDGVICAFGSALDIGCNAGFYSKVIADFGFCDVFGIDISEQFVKKANEEFGSNSTDRHVAFEVMNAADLLRAKNKTFDFILCTEVIEHTDKPDAVIQSIVELLAPGGVAVVSLPNCVSLGYFTSYLASLLRGRAITRNLRDHLSYPFYKGPALFRRRGACIVRTAGVNCLFNDQLLLLLYRTPLFFPMNKLNFWLSSKWPFKWFSQFFFFVITKA